MCKTEKYILRLKIGDVAGIWPRLSRYPGLSRRQLLPDIPRRRERSGAVTENAAPAAQGPVPVGTGAAGGQGELIHFCAVNRLQMAAEIVPVHRRSFLPPSVYPTSVRLPSPRKAAAWALPIPPREVHP